MGVAQLYFMPHPLLEIVQRLMAHPVDVLFLTEEAWSHGGLRTRELGQTPSWTDKTIVVIINILKDIIV